MVCRGNGAGQGSARGQQTLEQRDTEGMVLGRDQPGASRSQCRGTQGNGPGEGYPKGQQILEQRDAGSPQQGWDHLCPLG